jgi:hypothetical protein
MQCIFVSTGGPAARPMRRIGRSRRDLFEEIEGHRKARLNGGIAVGLLTATPACRRGIPAHLGVEPDRLRAPALERFTVGWPVLGPVGPGCGSAHVAQLPCWIHKMNPSRDLCNRALG